MKSVISRDSAIPPIITDNGDVIVDDYNKATHFNKFFSKSAVIDDSSASLPISNSVNLPVLNNIVVHDEEVLNQIKLEDRSQKKKDNVFA